MAFVVNLPIESFPLPKVSLSTVAVTLQIHVNLHMLHMKLAMVCENHWWRKVYVDYVVRGFIMMFGMQRLVSYSYASKNSGFFMIPMAISLSNKGPSGLDKTVVFLKCFNSHNIFMFSYYQVPINCYMSMACFKVHNEISNFWWNEFCGIYSEKSHNFYCPLKIQHPAVY